MTSESHSRFKNLTYEAFRVSASDPSLSKYERIGFPDEYRSGFESLIFDDIRGKLTNLDSSNKLILDVGPGASDLPIAMIEHCRSKGHRLLLVDSAEMLALLPDADFIVKTAGRFPGECIPFVEAYAGKVDAILGYSVLQYAFAGADIFGFVDQLLLLLTHGGQMLLGDVPNIDKRKRFFSSPAGIRHHQAFTGTDEIPSMEFNKVEPGCIDDSVVLALLARCRKSGFDAYVLPQAAGLPMANRREDLFVSRA